MCTWITRHLLEIPDLTAQKCTTVSYTHLDVYKRQVVAIEEAQQKNEEEQPSEEVCDVAQSENTDCKPEQSSCPPGQTSCPRENWGTSDEDQLQGWRECAACWNHYKKLHEHDEKIPKEENVGIEIPQDCLLYTSRCV